MPADHTVPAELAYYDPVGVFAEVLVARAWRVIFPRR